MGVRIPFLRHGNAPGRRGCAILQHFKGIYDAVQFATQWTILVLFATKGDSTVCAKFV